MTPPASAASPAGDSPETRLAALRERLLATAAAIRTAEDWASTLQAAARLPGESFANILLIEAQRPGATQLKGYEEWRAAGRQVIRGEQGIEIFSRRHPAGTSPNVRGKRETTLPAPGWRDAPRVAYAWDISQTSGPSLTITASHPAAAGEAPPGMWDALCWLARREGYKVEREHGAPVDGVTFWTPRRIRVQAGLDPGAAAWALVHQLGHVVIHGALPREPGATTSGDACTGTWKAEADAVAFITCTRYRIAAAGQLTSPATWAGTDPRAQPASVILAVGERIARAAEQVARHLDTTIPGARPAITSQSPTTTPVQPSQQPSRAASTRRDARSPAPESLPRARLLSILREAQAFYSAQVPGTWVPAYLESRGISPDTVRAWQFGYAPREWTALTDDLRAAGYADEEIQAAGLARRSTRETLIDHFRDRVMLPIRNEDGHIAGFTGRARPGTEVAAPKYLNSPETTMYKKGDLLFGLHEARTALAGGAMPVIVEGTFDAIAVTIAGDGQFAGLAPCGTALTISQAALLARACDLRRTGALVAFDDDQAGRKAAIRAYAILRPHTPVLQSAALAGRDPAEILQADGPTALRDTLSTTAIPLLGLIIDAELSRWSHRLGDVEGPLRAMRSAAATLASLLPPDVADQVKAATGNTKLATVDDDMHPVMPPQAPAIAQALPPDTAFQVTRLADKLGFTITETTIEVANAVTRQPPGRGALNQPTTAGLAAGSFPVNPLDPPDERATAPLRRSAPPGQAWASHRQHSANQL